MQSTQDNDIINNIVISIIFYSYLLSSPIIIAWHGITYYYHYDFMYVHITELHDTHTHTNNNNHISCEWKIVMAIHSSIDPQSKKKNVSNL